MERCPNFKISKNRKRKHIVLLHIRKENSNISNHRFGGFRKGYPHFITLVGFYAEIISRISMKSSHQLLGYPL